MKRQHTPVLHGVPGSLVDKTNDFLCPICFDVINDAQITRCGHTFCLNCIRKALETNPRCPKCGFVLANIENTFPNILLNDLIVKYKSRLENAEKLGQLASQGTRNAANDSLRDLIANESRYLTLPDVNSMLDYLQKRKQRLEAESSVTQNKLLHDFLKNLLKLKERQLCDTTRELSIIKNDIDVVEDMLKSLQPKDNGSRLENHIKDDRITSIDTNSKNDGNLSDSFVTLPKTLENIESSLSLRNHIIQAHFDDFVKCYFSCRAKDITFGRANDGEEKLTAEASGLDEFRENLTKFTSYSRLRPIATLSYSNDLFNNSTIVSSIEFDKDSEFFAIAGVTKRIKVYDFAQVTRDMVDIHYPCTEMTSSSKISCISWNTYRKGILASSDYEGAVSIWDTAESRRIKTFQEHEKRCWSVDFNSVDTRLVASGSDDARVKIWSLDMDRSVASLEVKANVCCVKFNPKSSCHLAFGSADHCVHYYDLRHMKQAAAVFQGHRKAVSYVKFLNKDEIVSASTDSQLKLWNVSSSCHCLRSYMGHVNEKNFVGLATDDDYIACGSENNSLYVYYKGLCKKLLQYKFDGAGMGSMFERGAENRGGDRAPAPAPDDLNEFVSAVCWKQNSNVVIAANSQGIIKIFELV